MKKITTLICTLCLLCPVQKMMAQKQNNQPSATLNHIAVYVSDLKTSTTFYEEIFNLKQTPEPFKDGKHTWFTLGAAGNLHLIQGAKPAQQYDKNEHLCFSVPSIDQFIAILDKRKVQFESWIGDVSKFTLRVDGVKQVYFKDPDGHWLEVNDAH